MMPDVSQDGFTAGHVCCRIWRDAWTNVTGGRTHTPLEGCEGPVSRRTETLERPPRQRGRAHPTLGAARTLRIGSDRRLSERCNRRTRGPCRKLTRTPRMMQTRASSIASAACRPRRVADRQRGRAFRCRGRLSSSHATRSGCRLRSCRSTRRLDSDRTSHTSRIQNGGPAGQAIHGRPRRPR